MCFVQQECHGIDFESVFCHLNEVGHGEVWSIIYVIVAKPSIAQPRDVSDATSVLFCWLKQQNRWFSQNIVPRHEFDLFRVAAVCEIVFRQLFLLSRSAAPSIFLTDKIAVNRFKISSTIKTFQSLWKIFPKKKTKTNPFIFISTTRLAFSNVVLLLELFCDTMF